MNIESKIARILEMGRPGRETDRARKCVALAVDCSQQLSHNFIDSCHLLAGMFREGNGVAFHVLDHFDVTGSQIDEMVLERPQPNEQSFMVVDDVQLLFDRAVAACTEMKHSYLGTEHLLIGAASDGTGSAMFLCHIGLIPSEVENEVYHLLGHRL